MDGQGGNTKDNSCVMGDTVENASLVEKASSLVGISQPNDASTALEPSFQQQYSAKSVDIYPAGETGKPNPEQAASKPSSSCNESQSIITSSLAHNSTVLTGPSHDMPASAMPEAKCSLTQLGMPPSTREMISHNAQTLIEDINNKRKQDTQLISDYKKALEVQTQKSCSLVEQTMFDLYEQQNTIVQEKLQELFATLDRIAILEKELAEFRQALGAFYQEVA